MSRASRGSPLARLRHAAGALLLLLTFLPAGPAGASHLNDRLKDARRHLEDIRKEQQRIEARVAATRAEIQSLTNQVSQVTAHLEALHHAKEEAQSRIKESREQAEELQVQLEERAHEVYIQGPAGVLELILEAESLTDLADRFSFLERLSLADANVAAGLETEQKELTDLRVRLREYEEEKRLLLERLAGQEEQLNAKFAKEQALKAQLDEKAQEAEEVVKDLTERIREEYLAQYGIAGGGNVGPPPSADGPFYWCPVDPPRSYIDDFGFPRVGHTHQGNDIFAPAETPIRAPFAGTAEESYNGLGGISVHVYAAANADYVYNAHLSRHAGVDGKQVQPGEVIGFVGTTGNAAGTPPHNHFEYHPGGGSAVSPYVYLNEVCGTNGQGFA